MFDVLVPVQWTGETRGQEGAIFPRLRVKYYTDTTLESILDLFIVSTSRHHITWVGHVPKIRRAGDENRVVGYETC